MAKPKRLSSEELSQVVDSATERAFGISRTAAILQNTCMSCGAPMIRKFVLRSGSRSDWGWYLLDGMCTMCRQKDKLKMALAGQTGAFMYNGDDKHLKLGV